MSANPTLAGLVCLCVSSLVPSLVRAQEQSPLAQPASAPAISFGVRVGGYGFRNPEAHEPDEKWNDCRMNGIGVFGSRTVGQSGFIEAGTDFYFSDTFPMEHAHGQGMDRVSGLLGLAGGLRMFPGARVSGYALIGLGLEFTRVTITQEQDSYALPIGFIGFGADVGLLDRVRLGASIRTYVMGHFDHHHADSGIEVQPELANQAQFYVAYSL